MSKRGPIESVQEWIPGKSGCEPTGKTVDNGLPGYPKGTPGKIDQVTLVTEGIFGKVPRADRKGE